MRDPGRKKHGAARCLGLCASYLLAAAAEEDGHTVDGTVTGLQGWIDCFPKARLVGTVFAGGVTSVGEIQGHVALEQAHEMGRHA